MRFGCLPLLCCFLFNVVCAQKISYSETLGSFDNTGYKIIGAVKDHIIIWEYFNNYSTSKILVYDEDLKLLNKIRFNSIKTFSAVNFINEKDSFAIICQYVLNGMFVCKRMRFDENGNNTGDEILKSYNFPAGVLAGRAYRVIQSPDKKNFILIDYQPDEASGKTRFSYILFANNKDRFEHFTYLPFKSDSTTSYNISLDNANHLIVVAGEGKEDSKLVLYEINPGTGDVAGIERNIPEGVLNMESLNISHVSDRVFITAHWRSEQDGIFVWRPDLYNFSVGKDTIYTVQTDSAFDSMKYAYLKTDIYPYRNTYNLFITVNQGAEHYPYSFSPGSSAPEYYPVVTGQNAGQKSFYEGRPTSVPKNSSTVNGVGTDAYNNHVNSDPGKISWQKQSPHRYANYSVSDVDIAYNQVLIYNIDENHNLRWYDYLTDTTENESNSFINPSHNIHTNQLYLFSGKVDDHNKEILNLISVDNKGNLSMKPVILMRVSYKLAFESGKKINDNTIVYPVKVKNKLAFIKIAIE